MILVLAAACQPSGNIQLPPTAIPFPTMTPGRLIQGVLPTVVGIPLDGSGLANPATAVALASQPTATPNYGACPTSGEPSLPTMPSDGRGIANTIVNFLSDGGTIGALTNGIREWGLLGEDGVVRGDVDFTGGGLPDVLLTYRSPDLGGTVLIVGCINGIYTTLYEVVSGDETPQIISVGDLNHDDRPDVLFTTYDCSPVNATDCAYRTDLRTFSAFDGRFVSLLDGAISSTEPPTVSDVDNDLVTEIVIRLTNPGDTTTGPLRTGVNIYDWNGAAYKLSIIQLDPPRFKIQVLQEADRAFAQFDTDSALSLYQLAQSDTGLRYWFNDEPDLLNAYTFYRLVLLMAYTEDDDLLPTYQAALSAYPDPAVAPVYIEMLNTFWNGFQVTHNLHSACLEVGAIIAARPEAVNLLNRYGSRSKTYEAQELCPF
jgi:hypothetical protein